MITYLLNSAVVGLVGWVFHTNSKINVLEQKHTDLKELIEAKFEGLDRRLERIEYALNGSIRKGER